jgi:hypothetical protein
MPALFPSFAQKSTTHKSQNLYKAIYRSAHNKNYKKLSQKLEIITTYEILAYYTQ